MLTNRQFRFIPLFGVFLFITLACQAQRINVTINEQGALFTENDDSVLLYQARVNDLHGAFPRSNYIHPLYNLNGKVITEDFPEDHPHHRGIFWAWHQVLLNDSSIGDGWDAQDLEWDVVNIVPVEQKAGAQSIDAHVKWKSTKYTNAAGQKIPFIAEHTRITVFPASPSYRVVDISIQITALVAQIKLGGSTDAKGYGGFSARIKLEDAVTFTGAGRQVEAQNLPLHSPGWMDISQPEKSMPEYVNGFTIVAHPDNPGYPNPWILRNKRSMQNAVYPYPGSIPVELAPNQPWVLKYRIILHNIPVSALDLDKVAGEYLR